MYLGSRGACLGIWLKHGLEAVLCSLADAAPACASESDTWALADVVQGVNCTMQAIDWHRSGAEVAPRSGVRAANVAALLCSSKCYRP